LQAKVRLCFYLAIAALDSVGIVPTGITKRRLKVTVFLEIPGFWQPQFKQPAAKICRPSGLSWARSEGAL